MSGSVPALYPTADEIRVLYMCKAFTQHLLGPELLREASQAIEKNLARFPGNTGVTSKHCHVALASVRLAIRLIRTRSERSSRQWKKKRCAKFGYKAVLAEKLEGILRFRPLKSDYPTKTRFTSAQDMAKQPGKPYTRTGFRSVVGHPPPEAHQFDRNKAMQYPEAYNFQKVYDQNFGIVKKASFPAEIEFSRSRGDLRS